MDRIMQTVVAENVAECANQSFDKQTAGSTCNFYLFFLTLGTTQHLQPVFMKVTSAHNYKISSIY